MRTIFNYLFLALTALVAAPAAAQTAPADTVANPKVIYGSTARTYTIASIEVKGAPNYNPDVIRNYAGLSVGERVQIPGAELTNAAKRLMAQGLFSQVKIRVDKTVGNRAWLVYDLRQQPRIRDVEYIGMKKNEREDVSQKLHLARGNQISQNIVDLIVKVIKDYYKEKGFNNADVQVDLIDALDAPNEQIVRIKVNRSNKVKVNSITFTGNNVFSDRALRNAMKKTNISKDLIKIFSQKKFTEADYEADLERILEKYNEHGYRDAVIVSDSVVPNDNGKVDIYINLDEGKQYYLRSINWVGNTVYQSDRLQEVLDIKPGGVFNEKLLKKRLTDD
ncbi:MAG: outer membrane protein assembly factor BamA, partial [Muribaculaceae bacterium]|nr:outer membrane protein assembly factor BamA [Muribaculaceae bacterium]